jgi:hypothetical protein
MSSIRKIESSRANGARSHGPVTESGKEIASQNARRHALLARVVVLENESPDAFAGVVSEHLARFQPADGIEYGLVEEMAAAWWRLRRTWSIETQLLNDCFDGPQPGKGTSLLATAFKNPDDSRGLALLHRYETRLHNMYQRALKNLLMLQTLRVPNGSSCCCAPSPRSPRSRRAERTQSHFRTPRLPAPGPRPPILSPRPPAPSPRRPVTMKRRFGGQTRLVICSVTPGTIPG